MKQSSGDNSNNLQIETYNNYGLSYADTRDLCMDLIKEELDKYKLDAKVKALERNERFVEAFLRRSAEEGIGDKSILSEFGNPDMQYVFASAQRAFIRFGTDALEEMLTKLLIDRVKEKNRSIRQIALNEAITIVPNLMPIHIDMLSLTLICFLYYNNLHNLIDSEIHKDVRPYLQNISPLLTNIDEIQHEPMIFDYLLYMKCIDYRTDEFSFDPKVPDFNQMIEYLKKYDPGFITVREYWRKKNFTFLKVTLVGEVIAAKNIENKLKMPFFCRLG